MHPLNLKLTPMSCTTSWEDNFTRNTHARISEHVTKKECQLGQSKDTVVDGIEVMGQEAIPFNNAHEQVPRPSDKTEDILGPTVAFEVMHTKFIKSSHVANSSTIREWNDARPVALISSRPASTTVFNSRLDRRSRLLIESKTGCQKLSAAQQIRAVIDMQNVSFPKNGGPALRDPELCEPDSMKYVPEWASIPPPRFRSRKMRTQKDRHEKMQEWWLQRCNTRQQDIISTTEDASIIQEFLMPE
ncbi:hypothetical protein ACN47E_002303 [Coniothyrium glycines]